MQPHGTPLTDAARLHELLVTGLLDSPVEETFDRVTRLLSRELGVPVAAVSLVDDQRQFFKSQVGIGAPWERGTPLSHSFCQHVVTDDDMLVVEDSRSDARVQDNLAVDDLGVVAYAGAPIRSRNGLPLGSLCAIDHEPRHWEEHELALIRELADVTSELIAMRTAAISTRAAVLDLSHEVRTRLSALRLEAEELGGSAGSVREGLATLSEVVASALSALEDQPHGHEKTTDVAEALAACASRAGAGVEVTVPDGLTVTAAPSELAYVLDALVETLQRHGHGTITLTAAPAGPFVRVRVQGDSAGLPDEVAKALLRRSDNAEAGDQPSLADRAAAGLGARLVMTSSRPTTVDLLLQGG